MRSLSYANMFWMMRIFLNEYSQHLLSFRESEEYPMVCFSCRQNCPTKAIEIQEDITTCIRLLEGRPPVWIHEETCNDCGKCAKTCPMGDITQSAETCSFCIICKGKTNCIILHEDRENFLNVIRSLAGLIIIIPRIILKKYSEPALPAGH